MISGANEEDLIIATARADIILKLNNTNEYKSWIILDNYIDKLQEENQQLKENNLAMQEEMARTWVKLEQKEEVIKQLLTYLDKNKLTLNNPNILDFYINVKKILNIEKSDKQ